MVDQTQETMTKMFDNLSDTFRSTMDACRRQQEGWFKFFDETPKTPTGVEHCPMGFENASKTWLSFAEKNFQNFTKTCDTTFDAGLTAAKTAVAAVPTGSGGDYAEGTQKAFQAAMTAFGANVDALGKAGLRTAENYNKLMQSAWPMPTQSKGSESKGSGKGHSK